MLSSIFLSTLVAAGTMSDASGANGWNVHGFEKGKPVESLETDVIMASTRIHNGPAIVLLCSERAGLQTIYVYEPSDDLVDQVIQTQNFLRKKAGTVTIDEIGHEDAWLWKKRHGTLQAKTKSTGIKILNAAFSGSPVTFSFEDMEPVTAALPDAGDKVMSFVNQCSSTRVRPDKDSE